MSEETIVFNLELIVAQTWSELRKVESLINRTLQAMTKFGLPPDVEAAINKVQRLATSVQLLHTALLALQATTPIGYALAAVGAFTAAVSFTDSISYASETR